MSTKLWELSNDLREFERLIDDILESALTDEQKQQRLDHTFSEWLTLDEEFDQKCEAIAHYIKRLEALTEARKQEAKRIQELAKQSENQATRLRDYLLINMTKHDKQKIDGKTIKVSLRKKPAKVCLNIPIEEIPKQYQRIKIEPKLDEIKKLILADAQGHISWAFMSDKDEYSLIIK